MQQTDVILSCRVRLARNLQGYPFVNRQTPPQAEAVKAAVTGLFDDSWRKLPMGGLSAPARQALVEEHLASAELAANPGGALIVNPADTVAIMVNEEDHLRIQGILPGLALEEAYALCRAEEARIGAALPYSFDDRLGYLTACPTNLGTGMRASAMVHLAGLALTGRLESLLQRIAKAGIAVRGFYGEGSKAPGSIYQISNQYSLGLQEGELVSILTGVAGQLAAQEMRVRELLLQKNPLILRDMAGRAIGICRHALRMDWGECMQHISAIKLGVSLGVVGLPMAQADALIVACQSAQLAAAAGHSLDKTQESIARAAHLRAALHDVD